VHLDDPRTLAFVVLGWFERAAAIRSLAAA
jgi:hypothetical protein